MACGCGKTAGEQFEVQAKDGTVKTFASRPQAEAFAIKQGGAMVKRVSR